MCDAFASVEGVLHGAHYIKPPIPPQVGLRLESSKFFRVALSPRQAPPCLILRLPMHGSYLAETGGDALGEVFLAQG